MGWKEFIAGIVSGIIIVIVAAFLVNPNISFKSELPDQTSYIDAINFPPHYEFSDDETLYADFLDQSYKIKPPFLVFDFNSESSIIKPTGYYLQEKMPSVDDCIYWKDSGDKILITAKVNQFEVSECSVKFKYNRVVKKRELTNTVFNASWRNDYEDGKFYEEEGIRVTNKFSKPIRNYFFVYNQTNITQIKRKFSECKEIKTFVDEKETEHRSNFFSSSSIIAIKFDLASAETKEIIIRCYV